MPAGVLLRKGLRGVERSRGAGDNPPAGQRLLVPGSDGWYDRDSSGVETKLGGGGAIVPVQSSAPSSPVDGQLWYDEDDTSGGGGGGGGDGWPEFAGAVDDSTPGTDAMFTSPSAYWKYVTAAAGWPANGVIQGHYVNGLHHTQELIAGVGGARSSRSWTGSAWTAWTTPGRLSSRLTGTVTTTLATYTNVMTISGLLAGKAYAITVVGTYSTAATTTGIGFRIGGTCTATGIRVATTIYGLTATTYTQYISTTLNPTPAASTGVASASPAEYSFTMNGLIRVNAAGTLTLDVRSEVATSQITVQPETYFLLEEVA
jgi:hypothetical protein